MNVSQLPSSNNNRVQNEINHKCSKPARSFTLNCISCSKCSKKWLWHSVVYAITSVICCIHHTCISINWAMIHYTCSIVLSCTLFHFTVECIMVYLCFYRYWTPPTYIYTMSNLFNKHYNKDYLVTLLSVTLTRSKFASTSKSVK